MLKQLTALALVAITVPAMASAPKTATVSIPDTATPTLYECDGKDIYHETVQSITNKADGKVEIVYKDKGKTVKKTCVKEFIKAYG